MNRLTTCISSVLISPELLSELCLCQKQTSWRKCNLLGSRIKANLFLFSYCFWKCKNNGKNGLFIPFMEVTKEMCPSAVSLVQISTCDPSEQLLLFSFFFFLIIIRRFFTWIETTSSVFKSLRSSSPKHSSGTFSSWVCNVHGENKNKLNH